MGEMDQFKAEQRSGWVGFSIVEQITGTAAPQLLRFAGLAPGTRVLDVACGSGVVALTAARFGARVTGLDLTPELIARAKNHAALMRIEVDWHVGDAEAMPFADASFDVVVSQFGHMFAPRPEVVTREVLRVLRPGGTLAFSTWPPELLVGRSFAALGRYAPPPPEGAVPPALWGDPNVVRERLGSRVRNLSFARDAMYHPVLSIPHQMQFLEREFGPVTKLIGMLEANAPEKAIELRRELAALTAEYFEDNRIRQDFLLTRATKV